MPTAGGIVLAGQGVGAIAALRSLQKTFPILHILSDDVELRANARACDRIIETFDDSPFQIVVCAGYLKIIPEELLRKKQFINTHPSLLPKYRGMHALAWAMLNGEKYVGFTIHLMTQELDAGEILDQYIVEVAEKDSNQIMCLFHSYVIEHLGLIIKAYSDGEITPKVQDHGQATWVCKRNSEDCLIDFSSNIPYLKRFFKVLVPPYPRPYFVYKSNRFEVLNYQFLERDYLMHTGRIVYKNIDGIYVKVGDGILVIREVQEAHSGLIFNPASRFVIGTRIG